MKNKKSVELSLNAVVIAALLLGVLIVLYFIFTGFIGDSAKGIKNIRDSAIDETKGAEKCASIFNSDRRCYDNKPADTAKFEFLDVPGDFSDCKPLKKCVERREKNS